MGTYTCGAHHQDFCTNIQSQMRPILARLDIKPILVKWQSHRINTSAVFRGDDDSLVSKRLFNIKVAMLVVRR